MNTKRDKKIAEALGLCWHEKHQCRAALQLTCPLCFHELEVAYKFNPDFSTDSGMCLILRLGKHQDWWEDFLAWNFKDDFYSGDKWSQKVCDPINVIMVVFDIYSEDSNKLANELEQFLDDRGGGK